ATLRLIIIERYFSYLKEDIDHSHYDKYRLNKNRQYENNRICKNNRRRYRKPNLKEKNPLLITTNDDTISQLKQNPYLIKEQRKKQFQRSKISKERFGLQENLINSITEDFNLLNRIFLHENEQELKEKPYLAIKYQQESISEKEKLEKILQQYEIDHPLRLQSTQNRTIYSTENNLSTVII
ncbi:unnamed protein product, partial [Rotaria sp. Silwood1]